jgi:hypothetical protein
LAEIVVCEEHSQVYETWRERGSMGLRVAHVDFHCDMRSLFIDRRSQTAYFIGDAADRTPRMDSGNFLAVALMRGVVTSVRWVHDRHGGRRYDAGTVKYESDLTAITHRVRHRRRDGQRRPVSFEEVGLDRWGGPRPGEQLDIDWDGLASIDYETEYARRLVEEFLACEWASVPETTFLVYSPGYSNPDRGFFEEFIERLSERLSATVRRLPPPRLAPGLPKPPKALDRRERLKHDLVLRLHRIGVY